MLDFPKQENYQSAIAYYINSFWFKADQNADSPPWLLQISFKFNFVSPMSKLIVVLLKSTG